MRKRMNRGCLLGLYLVLFSPLLLQAQEKLFFRYEDAAGDPVIDDHVPPQFAHKGYTVLNKSGRVVEVVPRALTEAERRDANNPAVQARLRAEQDQRQRREDQLLLSRYSSVADIEDARLRRVNEIKVRINLLKGNLSSLKQQLENRQEQAAEIERSGEAVPEEYPKTIEALRAEIAETEAQVERHQVERTATEMRYGLEIERFKVLRPEQPSPP
jgi:uncharacterized small protein (DUF1192 family)